jgi:polynucleotide 5'-hydroxyl-kinase GRC3/NOL9
MGDLYLDIPQAWEEIDVQHLEGVLMVVGAPDTGKSTFARYLFHRLAQVGKKVAYLDGDPGQSALGPPTTMSLAVARGDEQGFPPSGELWRKFVGSVSPTGHMLPVVVGAARLIQVAYRAGVEAVVYDTSGLIDPMQGGLALKLSKIDLLTPRFVFAIQHENELDPLVLPLRRSRRTRVVCLKPSAAIKRRDVLTRQAYRAEQFARYFRESKILTLNWTQFAIFPSPKFAINRIVALEDGEGFALGLGIVKDIDRIRRNVTLLTPLTSFEGVDALVLGDVLLDPETFRDRRIYSQDF